MLLNFFAVLYNVFVITSRVGVTRRFCTVLISRWNSYGFTNCTADPLVCLKPVIVVNPSSVAGMALTFDSLIWGRESLHSAFGGMITWVAVMIWIYNRGKYTIRKGEFCFILSFIVGTAIISFLVASLAKEPEISLALSVLCLWPIGISFQWLSEVISKNDEKSMLLIMIVPYILIYFSGIYGISKNRAGSR